MELPKEKVKATAINPKSMILFAQPKMGKTTIVSQLDDALIMDLEQGSKFLEALKIEINTYDELVELIKRLREVKKETGKNAYKIGVIDTVTKLEDYANILAVKEYKKTTIGQNFTGNDITTLPMGAGYGLLRNSMNKLSNIFEELFDTIIFVAHLKEKSLTKDGKEITSRDIALTGKLATILPANVDAVGFLYRDRKNNMFLSFKASDELTAGARPEHLRGQDIEVATTEKDGSITYHWDRIFLPE